MTRELLAYRRCRTSRGCHLLFKNCVYFCFVEGKPCVVVFQLVRRSLLPENFKTVNRWKVGQRSIFGVQLGEGLEQNICEASSEICTIDV